MEVPITVVLVDDHPIVLQGLQQLFERQADFRVVAACANSEAALIAIDNKPALTFKVGSAVEEGLILQSATSSQVILAATRDGPALMTLDMPLLDK